MNYMRHPDRASLTQAEREGEDDWLDQARHSNRARFAETESETGLFDLPRLLVIIQRRFKLIAGIFGATVVLTLAVFLLLPAQYTATALVMIDPGQERVVGRDQALTETSPDSATVESAIEILRSERIAQQLVTSLSLERDRRWGGDSNADPSGDPTQSRVVETVARAIEVRRRSLSYVIEVSVRARDAAQAAAMANRLVELFQQSQVDTHNITAERANVWLTQRLEVLRVDVQAKEAAAETYRASTGLLYTEGSSLTELQIANVQTSVLAARADVAEKEARYQQVRELMQRGGAADTIAGVLNSEVIRELRAREADLVRRQGELEYRYGAQHPTVLNSRVELENLRAQVATEISRISTNLADEVEISRLRLRALEGGMNAARQQLNTDNGALVRLRELERAAAASRAVYESFLRRIEELSSQGSLNAAEAVLVSRARPPRTPSSPKPLIALLLALGLGVACAVGAAYLLDRLDDAVNSASDILRKTGLPTLVSTPAVPAKQLARLDAGARNPPTYLSENPMSVFAEAFRVLRTSVMYAKLDGRSRVVAMTSPVAGEGKTTTSLCLARVAAMSGQRTIIVDCDLRRRSLNGFLATTPQFGLLDVLAGDRDWRAVVVQDDKSAAHVLPLAATPLTTIDVFGSAAMRELVEELREAYDLVILDCSPVLVVAETRVLVRLADSVVLVGRWGKSTAAALSDASEQLANMGAPVLGVVLNAVDARVLMNAWRSYGDGEPYYLS